MIYASYVYTHGGRGLSIVHINGMPATGYADTGAAYGPTFFSNSDIIYIGPGFTGQLRRLQIFSPAAFELDQGSSDS